MLATPCGKEEGSHRKKESTGSFLFPGYSSCYYYKFQTRVALDPYRNGKELSAGLAHRLNVLPETAAHSARDWLPSPPPGRAVCGLAEHLGPRLVCLELDGEQLTDASFGALRRCSRLETLSVSYAEHLTDASLASIKAGAGECFQKTLSALKKRRAPLETFFLSTQMGHICH